MNVNPLVLHRVGTLMVLLLIGLTAILFIAGSDYSWLGMGAAGLALLAWALVDLEFGSRRRAVNGSARGRPLTVRSASLVRSAQRPRSLIAARCQGEAQAPSEGVRWRATTCRTDW